MSGGKRISVQKPLDIIVATRNEGKVREIREVLKGLGFPIRALSHFPNAPEVEEDGKSFEENALKKARFYSAYFGRWVLAEDSGLEVDVLKGRPGVFSARYAGERASALDNNRKLLREMEGVPMSGRKARFRCAMAIVSPDGREAVTEGSCEGKIGLEARGKKGFGYDPLFVLPRHGKTMAQLTLEEKNRISHRGRALRKLRKIIEKML